MLKNSISTNVGIKEYLNNYGHGILLKYNGKISISELDKNEMTGILSDFDSNLYDISIGTLHAFCKCDVLEWRSDFAVINDNENAIKCETCSVTENIGQCLEEEYWLHGYSTKHKCWIHLCGCCITSMVFEGTDAGKIDIHEYLNNSLGSTTKIRELCLIHRLFSTPMYAICSFLFNIQFILC